jgi:hypothetical protein
VVGARAVTAATGTGARAAQAPARAPLAALDRGLLAAVLGAVALALAGPIRSGDLWWHLRTGHWILDHGRLPDTDPFSHTAGDMHWILQEYGTQVLFALVHSAAGLWGLRLFGALLGVALLLYVLQVARRSLSGPWAVTAVALFAALAALKWELRPHLLSAFFLLRLQQLLFAPGAPPAPSNRTLLELLLLSCLWVQLHAEAIFAPLLTLGGLFGALLTVAVHRPPGLSPGTHLVRWGAAFLCTLGGTLLSPLGTEPHHYALFKRGVAKLYIDEWFPSWILPGDPRFPALDPRLFALVAAALLGTLALGIHWGWRRFAGRGERPRFEALAFLGACGALAFDARRYFWLLWFPLHEFLAERLGPARRWTVLARSCSAGLLLVLAASFFPRSALADLFAGRYLRHADPELFPVAAAELLAGAGIEGNLFHPYEWGGYLGWQLGGSNPVFLDGRTCVFEHIIPERWRAERDPEYATQVLRERDVRVIVFKRLVRRGKQTLAWRPPDADRTWIRAHADRTAEVWVRSDQGESLERLRHWYGERGAGFDPARGFVELQALTGDPRWREARLLPEAVEQVLAGPLAELDRARSSGDPAALRVAWTTLADRCAELHLGRSVRYAQEQLAAVESAGTAARGAEGTR